MLESVLVCNIHTNITKNNITAAGAVGREFLICFFSLFVYLLYISAPKRYLAQKWLVRFTSEGTQELQCPDHRVDGSG